MQIKQSSSNLELVFFMVDSDDHVTGKTGLSPSVTLSKNGAAFASPAGAVSEIGNGFYKVAANATDSNTLGILALTATAAGADRCAMAYEIVANLESDSIAAIAGLNNLSAAGVRGELATELARIDTTISSRNATAPDNAGIAAIKAKTDNLPSDPADQSLIMSAIGGLNNLSAAGVRGELATELSRIDVAISSRNATVPDNAGIAAIKAKTDNLPASPADTGDIPSIPDIISAAGGLTVETVAALEAANQILLASPYVPDQSPVLIIPAPETDGSLTVVYVYTESITNVKRAGIEITVQLITTPAKSERVLEIAAKTMTTDENGYAQITVQRGHRYRVMSPDLALNHIIEPATETLDLLTLVS